MTVLAMALVATGQRTATAPIVDGVRTTAVVRGTARAVIKAGAATALHRWAPVPEALAVVAQVAALEAPEGVASADDDPGKHHSIELKNISS